MTSIVGVLCRDGVVIGSDSSATFGNGQLRTMEQPYQKLEVIGSHVLLAGTGQIGLGQRFSAVVKKTWDTKGFSRDEKGNLRSAIEAAKHLCRQGINDFAETNAPKGQYGALVAFPCEQVFHLCEFSVDDFQPEMKTERLWYCSMGCAQPITDPFLAFVRDVFWSDGLPTVRDAINAVTWTLDHAVQVNPGGVNGPIQLGVLEKGSKGLLEAKSLSDAELGEARQFIHEAKQTLKMLKQNPQAALTNVGPPPVPKSSGR